MRNCRRSTSQNLHEGFSLSAELVLGQPTRKGIGAFAFPGGTGVGLLLQPCRQMNHRNHGVRSTCRVSGARGMHCLLGRQDLLFFRHCMGMRYSGLGLLITEIRDMDMCYEVLVPGPFTADGGPWEGRGAENSGRKANSVGVPEGGLHDSSG